MTKLTSKFFCGLLLTGMMGGCATKSFDELHTVDYNEMKAMSCEDIEREFLALNEHEGSVNKEATGGQAKQILWGGIWSVMADEKREDIARDQIRKRERQLYEAKIDKKC